MQGRDGNFYGTAWQGGYSGDYGTAFGLTPTDHLTMLYGFRGFDGMRPNGPLVQGPDDFFYGTTMGGGGLGCDVPDPGCGTVFKLNYWGGLTMTGNP